MVWWPTGPSCVASASSERRGAALSDADCLPASHSHAHSPLPRLCLLCFWTVKASVSLCSYVVNDKPAYNPDDSAVDVRPPGQLQDVWLCDCILCAPIFRQQTR